jgi:hypothetical protein
MPYIPPHLRPGYVPKHVEPVEPVEPVRRRRIHFPTNADNANNRTTNIRPSSGKHSPTKNKTYRKKPALKRTKRISPNRAPPAHPTSNIEKLPKKFRDMFAERGIKHLASPN